MENKVVSFRKDQKRKFWRFVNGLKEYEVVDLYEDLYVQHMLLKSPKHYFSNDRDVYARGLKGKLNKDIAFSYGSWVVVPPLKKVFHLLERREYLQFRTIRNRDLITWRQQLRLYNKKIIFIGMSVGSQVLVNFVRTGIGNNIVLVDADKVELHNINRTGFVLQDNGRKKVKVVRDMISSIDPYIKVNAIDSYLTEDNLKELVKGVDLIVDSFDDFRVKIKLRKLAKKLRVPVLSGFDISKGAMVVSERYDKDSSLDIKFYLNGHSEKELLGMENISIKEKTDLFIKIIGRQYHDDDMMLSVRSVGSRLTGYPQLSIATLLASSMWAVAALDILLGKVRESLRVYVNLDKAIYEGTIN
jgi:hypothetical protein